MARVELMVHAAVYASERVKHAYILMISITRTI